MDETDEPVPSWAAWEWSQVGLSEEMRDALIEACSGDEAEAEAYAAYLCKFPTVLDEDADYTAEQARLLAQEAELLTYDHWDDIADEWIKDHGGEEVMTMLYSVADDNEDAVLKQVTATLGRQLAESDGMHWFFETGLLLNGLIYCFKRPC